MVLSVLADTKAQTVAEWCFTIAATGFDSSD
jgi:hypothetical protein